MQIVIDWIKSSLGLSLTPAELQTKLLSSLAIMLLLWLLRMIIVFIVNRQTDEVPTQYRWRKISTYLVVVLGIILVGRIWLAGLQTLATFLGLLSAGLAIALQGPITDLAGWLFILWRRPFEVGDRIQLGEHAGDVVDVRIFQFTILEIGNWVDADQSTGRIMHIPNRRVFAEALANYSLGFEYIWNEIPVLITFESDWEKAKTILQEIANRRTADLSPAVEKQVRQAARRFMILYPTLTPIVYTRVEASGVLLTIRYLCAIRRRRASEHEIWEDVLKAFAQHPDVQFAYPTQRFYTDRDAQPRPQPTDDTLTPPAPPT